MILVTTAGKVGTEAARLLREQDTLVRVLVRDPGTAAATALAAAGAQIAAGDLDVPATIDAAMDGVRAVILVSPAAPAQELNVVASAARAGVAYLVKVTSNASADSPIARRRGQAEIEAGLAAAGIPHTLLRSNAYMQNVLALAPAIAATSSFGSAAGKGRAGMIDARDVAAVAATIAASPAPHAGKTCWLTGPELLSNYDVATILSKLLGRTITYRELIFEENKDAMIRAGVPESIAQQNAQAFSLTADGDAAWVTDDVPAILGRPARSFKQFAADRPRRRVHLTPPPRTPACQGSVMWFDRLPWSGPRRAARGFCRICGFLRRAGRAGDRVDGPLYTFLRARWTIDPNRDALPAGAAGGQKVQSGIEQA